MWRSQVRPTERLTIETPEQIALEFPIAGIGSRFLALAIDTLLQVALFVAGFVLFVLAGPRLLPVWSLVGPYALALFILFLFCVYWGYFAFFEIIWKGQTPGKRVARIRVINESGRPINVYQAIARNLVRAIDLLPGMYAVGVVCMMVNRYSRRLGDFVAGTVVVHDRQTVRVRADWRTAGGGGAVAGDAARLATEELVLIETYLQRRTDLDADVRDRSAQQIADRVTAKTGLQRGPGQQVDDFLEAVARQIRDTARYH
jgi:uncharacterized RDD family membrane protein YckC